MTEVEFNTEKFEKDSLKVFEHLLQGYRKAKQSNVWDSELDELVGKLTYLPNSPFTKSLMKIFDYDYLVLSNDINSIIEKALVIRERMEHTKRYVTINKSYYNLPFISKEEHLKKLEVFDSDGELCYSITGKVTLNYKQLFKRINPFTNNEELDKLFFFNQNTFHHNDLEIYNYSQFVDCSISDIVSYYDFFCDYYGKVQFIQFFQNKEKDKTQIVRNNIGSSILAGVASLTDPQQVLWAYFFLR